MVGPDGLVVRAPRWTPLAEVEAALQEKAAWIVRKLQETSERQARQDGSRMVWQDGAALPFLGELVRLQLDPGHEFVSVGAHLNRGAQDALTMPTLRIGLAHNAKPEQLRDAVQAWLMRQARDIFQQRLDHFSPQLHVQWRKLSLSSANTRWGSAKVDGSIRLNWRLIHFKQSVIDYVVVHELSHLRVMDHSAQFWDTVRSVVPDYTMLRKQLKDDALPKW
jgi:predicted metal-dependent hydrolase